MQRIPNVRIEVGVDAACNTIMLIAWVEANDAHRLDGEDWGDSE